MTIAAKIIHINAGGMVMWFAIILLIEKLFLSKLLNKTPKVFRWLYSFILINIGWIIFRSESFELMIYVFKNIFVISNLSINMILSLYSYSILPTVIIQFYRLLNKKC
jgi:alginate O-acetyltransferase complex protein AlgI